MKRVELVDASILINVINVPMEAANRQEVLDGLDERVANGIDLVLPIAAIVETAQHVQRIVNGYARRVCAEELSTRVEQTIRGELPWVFVDTVWNADFVRAFFEQSPPCIATFVESLATKNLEAGDLLLIQEFERLRSSLNRETHRVDVWTLDGGLRSAIDCLISL